MMRRKLIETSETRHAPYGSLIPTHNRKVLLRSKHQLFVGLAGKALHRSQQTSVGGWYYSLVSGRFRSSIVGVLSAISSRSTSAFGFAMMTSNIAPASVARTRCLTLSRSA